MWKTIKKFLGANYEVMASNGHVRDLPKSQLGFEFGRMIMSPSILQFEGKEMFWQRCVRLPKGDKVYLATDLTVRERQFLGIWRKH